MGTNWKKGITTEMKAHNDSWDNLKKSTLSDEELEINFDNSYGGTEGSEFTLWTKDRVYFPICYDGSEWVGSVPRKPSNEKTHHHGGG